jgi:prepilin-type N-terminal cleavage/methylation domain-containing protein
MIEKKTKGFTLIELLVVVAIIGLLVSLISIGFGTARLKSRDARRLSDVQQVRSGLELYFAQGQGYPNTALWIPRTLISCNSQPMFTVPIDPSPVFTYTYASSGNSFPGCGGTVNSAYKLQFVTEGTTDYGPAGTYCVRPAEGVTSGVCP